MTLVKIKSFKGFIESLSKKIYGGLQIISEIMEATTSNHYVTGDFLQCIYSVLVANNHQKF